MGSRSEKSPGILILVFVVWAVMFIGAITLVQRYGTRTLPQSDELWVLHDAGPGIHPGWLWKTWAEHRIPLAKLLWKSILESTAYNFQTGDFLTVIFLATTALAMIWAAGRIRGYLILADAFFPLALLNFGQAQVFLWWWQVNHVLAPVVAGAITIVLLVRGNNLQLRQAILIGLGLILLAVCGPGGLPYVVALSAWLVGWGVKHWPSFNQSQRRQALIAASTVVIAFLLVALYFVDYTPYFPANDPPTLSEWPASPGLFASATAALQILALSLGTGTEPYATLCGLAVLAFALVTFITLIRLCFNARERWRALAFMALLGAQTVLVLTIAWSRAGMGLDYLYQGHYLTILAPALCCMYFVWEIRADRLSRFVQAGMVMVLALILPLSLSRAMLTGRTLEQETAAFESDIKKGIPPSVLAERHFASDVVPRADKIAEMIREYKADGIGIFKEVRDDPKYRIESLVLDHASLDRAVVVNGIVSSQQKSSIAFALPRPQHVYAVRLQYAYVHTTNLWPTLHVSWSNSAFPDFDDRRSFVSTVPGPDQPTWALVDGKIHTDAKVRTRSDLDGMD